MVDIGVVFMGLLVLVFLVRHLDACARRTMRLLSDEQLAIELELADDFCERSTIHHAEALRRADTACAPHSPS
jgi:hypothetical protein